MRCIDCGKYPFCKYIKNPQEEACEKSKKRKLEQIINRLERRDEK